MKVKFSHTDQINSIHIPCVKVEDAKVVKFPLKFDGKIKEVDSDTLLHICSSLTKRNLPGDCISGAVPGHNLSLICKIEVESVDGFVPIDIEAVAVNGYIEPKEVSAEVVETPETPAVNTETTDDNIADTD